jgi:hypothetical protein
MRQPIPRRPCKAALLGLLVLVLAVCGASSAYASAPRWQLSLATAPTNLSPGGEGQLALIATNIGDGAADGASAPVTITEKLPPHLIATSVLPYPFTTAGYLAVSGEPECALPSSTTVQCSWSGPTPLAPYEAIATRVDVKAEPGASSGEQIEGAITGGEAASTAVSTPLTIDSTPTPFGVTTFEAQPENEDGTPDSQAGSHPFQYTTTIAFNQALAANRSFGHLPSVPALVKDLDLELPPGLIGNPTSVAQCTSVEFETLRSANVNLCPAATAIGVAIATIEEPDNQGITTIPVPVFNLVPENGEPARFGFEALGVPVVLDTRIRAGRDYGVDVEVADVPELAGLISSTVVIWGVPGDARHDPSRGWSCLHSFAGGACVPSGETSPPAFLSMPTSCRNQAPTILRTDAWNDPGAFLAREYSPTTPQGEALQPSGCNKPSFDPSFSVTPETDATSTPTGMTVGVHVPQEGTTSATGVASADVKNTTVSLAGLQVNSASADGLEACPEGEPGGVGFTGLSELQPGMRTATFTETLPAGWETGEGFCPNASKVGTVEIETPLLAKPLQGAVYLAQQNANPFSSLLALYIVAENKASGVHVELAGKVSPDPNTGQLTSTFENTPQLPFEELKLHFFGGSRAPVATAASCGTYTSTASFTPWSGAEPATPQASFDLGSGPYDAPCANPPPFSPSLTAGTSDIQAGAFAPFTTSFSRQDSDQELGAVSMRPPAGLLGMLSRVTPCPEAQAALGTCSSESEIGHISVSVGLGETPYTVAPGKVFITGPYKGAPYGLSIAEPAKAGPFDLGEGPCDCIVVRAKIEVDPNTAALTVTSDSLPRILQGIPLEIKRVEVNVDRPGFTFNPTDCKPLAINAVLQSQEGATAPISVPFQVANCATLPFKPKLTASTKGQASKANGASFAVKLESKGLGQANIAKVRLQLPKALPARLTTLQKACTERVFDANPASCPQGSVIGEATIHTPVVKSPLTGPAYLVSHGGAAFPDVEFVLQAEGITLVLDGKTQIKKEITYSNFESAPDAPFTVFEALLPVGPHSALTANLPEKDKFNLCKASLSMPTEIVGQNGAVTKQNTTIAVTGCKPAITVASHSVKGKTATIAIKVPSPGKLVVSGKGLSTVSKAAGGAGTVTVKVTLSSKEQAFLARQRGRKLAARIKLLFTPTHGAKLSTSVTVRIR